MKLLGIDYGAKRIGLAIADEERKLAFPYDAVIENNKHAFDKILAIIKKEEIQTVVMGESKDYRNNPNPIMKRSGEFAKKLADASGVRLDFEPEFLTTAQARRSLGEKGKLDASAAAIILQSHLDKKDDYKTPSNPVRFL